MDRAQHEVAPVSASADLALAAPSRESRRSGGSWTGLPAVRAGVLPARGAAGDRPPPQADGEGGSLAAVSCPGFNVRHKAVIEDSQAAFCQLTAAPGSVTVTRDAGAG